MNLNEEYSLKYDPELLRSNHNVYMEHRSVSHDLLPHAEPYMIIVYASHGKGGFYISNTDYEVCEGEIFFINPNVRCCFYSPLPNIKLSIYGCCFFPAALPFKLESLIADFPKLDRFLSGNLSHIHTHDTSHKDIRNLFINMLDDFSYSHLCAKYTVKSLLTLTVVNTLKICSVEKNSDIFFNSNVIVGDAINYINHNLYTKISLNEIAQLLHITPQHLCREFKKNTGKTFTEFVNELRVKKIKDELENIDRPIHKIYDDFDFSPKHINKLFFRQTGYTLSEYKRKFNYKVNNPLYKLK